MRIGIAGIAIESSTFSPHRTGLADFRVTRGADLLARYTWTEDESLDVEWVPLLHAVSLPGGAVLKDVYDALKTEILDLIAEAGPLDGLLLDIHGAMSVVGMLDAEADLARQVRAAVGPDVLISASMDLHGNVSRDLVEQLDLVTCYRMAPHEDTWETRERAARNLVARLRDGGKPHLAWVQIPVLLPGEKTSTRIEPAKSLYGQIEAIEAMDGILDAAIWVGYAWADEPRCQAAVVVTGDDAELVEAQAAKLAGDYWKARQDFAFVAPTGSLDHCVREGLASGIRPYFISDSGDNPTAGGAGDVSWTLQVLTAYRSRTIIYASIVDPESVAIAKAGGEVSLQVGGKIDSGPAGPVALTGTVVKVHEDPVGGTIVVVRSGGLHVIITERRKPYHLAKDFADLDLDPVQADLTVVKIGYLEPELYDMAKGWLLALTPGGVDQDLIRLGHKQVVRPLYPFDPDMDTPDLTAHLI
ncbi:M81 family metallopeptidase [Kibdelosporangium phytohabitans]|uniref:Microcystin degradation protein MlrC n=1 Tax=Kibdelosporangium phytohabitans TaxID=860235 RepID=A0A0N7F2H8_9PSEU|nr:M81 family metallopeptidase [Kibdelosporangium phytohabitans]ALG05871.1 microcystin degradation protein MlrC [Kibdelosporangium phytohabitans]MBE1466090.1 microcystin degradation protein MlrC [Kibdelosporangium phytohabitans]